MVGRRSRLESNNQLNWIHYYKRVFNSVLKHIYAPTNRYRLGSNAFSSEPLSAAISGMEAFDLYPHNEIYETITSKAFCSQSSSSLGVIFKRGREKK